MPPWWARRPARVLARSERLLLSPQRRSDWRAMAEAFEDDELLEWQGWTDSHASARVEAVRRGLHRSFRGFPANLTLRAPDTREYVGTYVLSWHGLDITTDEVILGWWLAARHRGKGLGTESLRLTLDAIRDRSDIATVRIGTRHDNTRVLGQLRAVEAEFVEERPTPLPDGSEPAGIEVLRGGGEEPPPTPVISR